MIENNHSYLEGKVFRFLYYTTHTFPNKIPFFHTQKHLYTHSVLLNHSNIQSILDDICRDRNLFLSSYLVQKRTQNSQLCLNRASLESLIKVAFKAIVNNEFVVTDFSR
jgi:hypothetical protein